MRSVTLLLVVLLLAVTASAEIPQVISYQGKVTDTSGNPVADGSYTMRFRIYDASTSGTMLWDSGNRSVTVSGGVFSVLLGESPQPAITLDFDQDYWLLVTFGGVDQTPRQRLGSVGYAYMASGLVPGTEVVGSVTSGTAAAIQGTNTATTGSTRGVYGWSSSTEGTGVDGRASATSGPAYGVYGRSNSAQGRGVYGEATATTGYTYGVYGQSYSTAGRGVYGLAEANSGSTYGVYGQSYSTAGRGVYGRASAGSGTTYGVYGQSYSTSGYGVYYSGGLAGTGTKSCVVKTSKGPTLLYCQESPENWFEDFGEGQLVDGRCHIELDRVFLETVTIDEANPMKVFVQLKDDCRGTFAKPGTTGFDVCELQGGSSNAAFCYRVVAKRKGFETKRLDYCAAAERDSYLYPELREKELQEQEAERARREEERVREREERRRMEEERAQMKAERARMPELPVQVPAVTP